jgi:hypothetical protein
VCELSVNCAKLHIVMREVSGIHHIWIFRIFKSQIHQLLTVDHFWWDIWILFDVILDNLSLTLYKCFDIWYDYTFWWVFNQYDNFVSPIIPHLIIWMEHNQQGKHGWLLQTNSLLNLSTSIYAAHKCGICLIQLLQS